MKKGAFPKILIFAVLLACCLIPVSAVEDGDSDESIDLPPQSLEAPVNPAFTEALDVLENTPLIVGSSLEVTGSIPSPVDLSHLSGIDLSSSIYASSISEGNPQIVGAPSSYDLRVLGRVTPVRNQGNCATIGCAIARSGQSAAFSPARVVRSWPHAA